LCDGEGHTETDELDDDEQDQTWFADFAEGLVGRGERFVSEEVKQFEGDAVSLESVCTHVPATVSAQPWHVLRTAREFSQEPSEHASRDEMENLQERFTEEDETECTLSKVRDPLLDYGDGDHL
jgi:hypothetical protein